MLTCRVLPVFALVLVAATATTDTQIAQARAHDDQLDSGRNSTRASSRLLKELKDFYNSDSYKQGLFTVELIDDNIYEWHVKIFVLDEKNQLHWDLKKWSSGGGKDHILLHVKYNENYPLEPPFVRVVYPYLNHTVLRNGGFCMELLSEYGWNSSYTIEPLILQIIAEKLSRARVESRKRGNYERYDYEAARAGFEDMKGTHQRCGDWTTPKPQV